mgnify:CR=1 FL=1
MTNLIIPDRPSHWYYHNGQPCYLLPMKTKPGELRSPTIRDAKELDLVPSVSGMQNMLYKPALEAWKMMQTVLSALTLPQNPGESQDDFSRRVVNDSQAESRRAADFGTNVHAMAESYVKGEIPSSLSAVEMTFLEGFMLWANAHEITTLKTEESFCNWAEGFGGRVDFIGYIKCKQWGVECNCPTPLDGLYIVDWKTQGTKGREKSISFYPDWNTQLSGYKHGLGLMQAEKLSVVISSTEPGRVEARPWQDGETDWGWETFKHLRGLWYSPLGPGAELRNLRGYSW